MFTMLIFSLLSLAFASLTPHDAECLNFGLGPDCLLSKLKEPVIITPSIDNGIYPLGFGKGNLGLSANVSFVLNVDSHVGLAVWDCFCVGDTLGILINGEHPMVTIDLAPEEQSEPCANFCNDPAECLFSNIHGFFVLNLHPGLNNITITAGLSPYHGGAGYAWFFSMLNPSSGPACFGNGSCNFNPIYPVDHEWNVLHPDH